MMLSITSCAYYGMSYVEKNVYLGLLPIFELGCLLLNCRNFLYLLGINRLSDA